MIVGWSLVNSCVETHHSAFNKEAIRILKEHGRVLPKSRVCVGQMFVDEPYRGGRLADQMTTLLLKTLVGRYDDYLATVLKTNLPSMRLLGRPGPLSLVWEDELRLYYVRPVIVGENSGIVNSKDDSQKPPVNVRLGQTGDEDELERLNARWTKQARGNDGTKGFLTSLYSAGDFATIIEAKEIIVAQTDTSL